MHTLHYLQAAHQCASYLQVGLKGAVHITGGGFPENLPRVLPAGCACQIDTSSWQVPPLYQWLQKAGAPALYYQFVNS